MVGWSWNLNGPMAKRPVSVFRLHIGLFLIKIAIEDEDEECDHGPVFVHFKHEGYKPIYMKPDSDGRITSKIMVPNTRIFFFFTASNLWTTSEDYQSIALEAPEIVKFSISEHEYTFMV